MQPKYPAPLQAKLDAIKKDADVEATPDRYGVMKYKPEYTWLITVAVDADKYRTPEEALKAAIPENIEEIKKIKG